MKILMLSPVPTHPPIAGNRARISTLIDALVQSGHELHFAWVPMEDGDRSAMRVRFGEAFTELEYAVPRIVGGLVGKLRRRILRMFGNESAFIWRIDDWFDEGLLTQLADLHTREKYDVVFVEYVFLSRALEAFPAAVIKVIDTHDRFADRHLKYLSAGKAPEWFSTTVKEERRGLLRADFVVAIQDSEASEFKETVGEKVKVVTVGHLLDLSHHVKLASMPSAVFVGSGNSINVDGARYFIDQVLPLVTRDIPEFKFVLAGDVCNAFSDDISGVRKLGRVEAVADAYSEGMIAINSVRMGTGLNIKTMECLALGIPLVSTEAGGRGLEVHRGQAFESVRNDDPAGMANAVLNLINNEFLMTQFSSSGRLVAKEWNANQLRNLIDVLERKDLRVA